MILIYHPNHDISVLIKTEGELKEISEGSIESAPMFHSNGERIQRDIGISFENNSIALLNKAKTSSARPKDHNDPVLLEWSIGAMGPDPRYLTLNKEWVNSNLTEQAFDINDGCKTVRYEDSGGNMSFYFGTKIHARNAFMNFGHIND